MTRVAIAGKDSYIGTRAARALTLAGIEAREIDVRQGVRDTDFAGADAVICVAGIAHQPDCAPERYFQVNRDLAVRVAKAARAGGAKQFVYMSSMSVYGLTTGHITRDTPPAPNTPYGQSKWEAEQALTQLETDGFRVAILRPPMVYGPGCKGNYPRLVALTRRLPFFPKVNNERSMVFIDTLCAFLVNLVQSGGGGLFFPQEREYVRTDELARLAARCHGKRLWLVPGFGWLLRWLAPSVTLVGKAFGSLTYEHAMAHEPAPENALSFEETIRRTEVGG